MRKLGSEEITKALIAAEKLRDGEDVDYLGHYTLQLHDRSLHLEDVYKHVYHYIHSGQASHEHAQLIRAIERAERAAHPHEDGPAVFPSS